MRLSDVLSKLPDDRLKQVEGFLDEKKLQAGGQTKIDIGKVGLPFFCKNCEADHTFVSQGDIFCIGVNDKSVSIDCVITCTRCELSSFPMWFLVICDTEIFSKDPNVKILKRSFKLSDDVLLSEDRFEGFKEMLNKARLAYAEDLGAGSVIYLRKILEHITFQTAEIAEISTTRPNGSRKPFRTLLEDVDDAKSIVPEEFSDNGYQLFGELSEVIHGNSDEQLALRKYPALRRLVIGVIEKVRNNQEIMLAINDLGLNNEGETR